jgi:hypothetical protein
MLEFWITFYVIGAIGTLYLGSSIREETGEDISNGTIVFTSAIWPIVVPPALLMLLDDEEDEN